MVLSSTKLCFHTRSNQWKGVKYTNSYGDISQQGCSRFFFLYHCKKSQKVEHVIYTYSTPVELQCMLHRESHHTLSFSSHYIWNPMPMTLVILYGDRWNGYYSEAGYWWIFRRDRVIPEVGSGSDYLGCLATSFNPTSKSRDSQCDSCKHACFAWAGL